ncbi:MAG: hypothetical protein Q8L69_11400 [Gallionellaceae bacterium]|nr:hypothetical protein [Gallionellaceae bacterium]
MKIPIRKSCFTALAILVLVSAPIQAMAGDSGTVMSVHSKEATAKFKAVRGLPPGQPDGGRFAVVKIKNGAYGDASFALVYVPPQFTVHEDSVVELDSSGVSVLSHPGSAAVYQVINDEPSSLMTRSADKLSQIWLSLSIAC